MSADEWLGAIAGGLDAYDRGQRDDREFALKKTTVDQRGQMERDLAEYRQKQAELKAEIEKMKEGGRNTRAETASADRNYAVDTRAAVSSGNNQRTNATRERGQDLGDTHYWDKAQRDFDLGWGRVNLGQRGQDIRSADTRRGQDLTYGAREDAIDSSDSGRAMGYALRAYNADLARRRQNNSLLSEEDAPTFSDWVKESDDPEIFPSVRSSFGGAGATPPAAGDMTTPPARSTGPKTSPVPGRTRAGGGATLEAQAASLIQKIKAADAAGQDSSALREQLRQLRAQVK
jgi:hypothetical protein